MALQIYNAAVIGSGIQVDLGTVDDVYIGAHGFISSTDNVAVRGSGSNHSVTVEGSIVAVDTAISLGASQSADSGQRVMIGSNATVVGTDVGIFASGNVVTVYGYGSSIENNGVINGKFGVLSAGDAASGSSELVNSGAIHALDMAVQRAGSEDFHFTNNGIVSSQYSAYYGHFATGDQTLVNSGRMTGAVDFSIGNDIYSGINGKVTDGRVSGNDGNDTLIGGKYADNFEGDAGRDILKGGAGADHFIFTAASDSTVAKAGRDLIQDFSHTQHDRIDFSNIDAEASSAGTDEKFSFIGTNSFSGAEGELRYSFKGSSTFVQGDTDGDKHADFSIELKGHVALHAGDFIL